MSFMVNPYLFGVAPPAGTSEFYPVAVATGNGTSYTVNFGDEDPDRYLIVSVAAAYTEGNGTLTSVTIGGVLATQLVKHGGAGNISGAGIYIAAVPTGTSGNITLSVTNYNSFTITVYRAVGLASAAAYDTDTISALTFDSPVNGVSLVTVATYETGELPATVNPTDGMLKAYERARSNFYSISLRGIHTWKVTPSGDTVSSTTIATGSSAGASLEFSNEFAAPVAFGNTDWSIADALTDGELLVTLTAIKSTGVTDIEYRVDGGSWTSAGVYSFGNPSGTGKKFAISGLTNGVEYDVEIRPVTLFGNGAASSVKSATPTDGGITVTYLGTQVGASNDSADTYSVGFVGGGHPHAKRVIVVGLATADDLGGTSNDPSGVTVNGVSATRQATVGAPGARLTQLWAAAVPSGDDEIKVGFTNSAFTTAMTVSAWRAQGLNSITAQDILQSGTSPTSSGTMDVTAGGFMIGYFRGHNSNAVAWTGLAIEDIDQVWATSRRIAAAHDSFVSAQTNLAVSAGQTSGSANRLVVASWGN